jgi:hypothetical protein
MKKINIIVLSLVALMMASCAAVNTRSKEVKHMDIRFEPLTRKDFTLVGNLEAESTITGKMAGKQKVLDRKLEENKKEGKITAAEATEILYFAPKPGEAITGSLYENEIFNRVYTNTLGGESNGIARFFQRLFGSFREALQQPDPAITFAYYELVEKYPDVDYFINVRFDRELIVKGKNFTEKVIVRADGVVLRVD